MEDALALEARIRAEAEDASTPESQAQLRTLFLRWKEKEEDLSRKKELAVLLSRGEEEMDRRLAVEYLRECLAAGVFVEEALFVSSCALFALGEYEDALKMCQELLSQHPDSLQVRSMYRAIRFRLQEELDRRIEKGQRIGMAIGVGGLVIAAAFVVARSFANKKGR